MNWAGFVAVYGGTFDPPHLGHREAVRGLFQNPGVSSVIVLPSGIPPFKSQLATDQQRLEMTRLNFASCPTDRFPVEVTVDDREIRRSAHSPSRPSYTYDTLLEMRQDYPKLVFVLGSDQFAQIHRWHRFPEVLGLCSWIVLGRKPGGEKRAWEKLQELGANGIPTDLTASIHVLETRAPEVSSSSIREAVGKTGAFPLGKLLEPVATYLKQNRIYGISSN